MNLTKEQIEIETELFNIIDGENGHFSDDEADNLKELLEKRLNVKLDATLIEIAIVIVQIIGVANVDKGVRSITGENPPTEILLGYYLAALYKLRRR